MQSLQGLSHKDLCDKAASLNVELAELECAELEARRSAWFNCGETSVSGREAAVRIAISEHTKEIVLIKGEIRAVEYALRAVEWEAGIR